VTLRVSLVVLIAICSLARTAASQSSSNDAAACADAFERGQVERNDGKLLDARRDFLACAQDDCPAVVKAQCAKLHAELAQAVPSIVVSAKDKAGTDVPDVRLLVDGVPRGERLDGKPIELDPGEHRLRLEKAGSKPVEQTIVIAEGERARLVRFALPIGEAPPSTAPRSDAQGDEGLGLVLVGVGFGVAGAALIAGIVTGVIALEDGRPCLENEPKCDEEYIETHQPLAHASTACFAIAGAGAIVGVVGLTLYLTGSPSDSGRIGLTLRGAF